ncbi:GDYXXLXY domain-containing protein [Flavobacterium sp.]|uniref:GDYXXLXY domain-containing protein n=1 Tax=Flavobacterium sp. TaxID=239 RepID=UPI002B4B6E0D|nr:GDYXXLXY domain-containing protein [Flavobacterium sp.]HLF53122.1 GDYXXLXY domain-containing protein [Flavobacterium sp.]
MKNKKTLLILFILVVLAQLYVPLQMIFDQEDVLKTGKEFKFQTEPVDPNDPFRGKYITLSFKVREITVKNIKNWQNGETIFAKITTDKNGFAKIAAISKSKPKYSSDYLKVKINAVSNFKNENIIFLDFPFNRFYMNENKAQKAEEVYAESITDSINKTFALVAVKNGEAVIKDVLINEVSIKELANKK